MVKFSVKWQNCSDILETKHGAMLKHGVMLITWSFADSVLLCVSHIKLSVYFVGSQIIFIYTAGRQACNCRVGHYSTTGRLIPMRRARTCMYVGINLARNGRHQQVIFSHKVLVFINK